MPKVLYVKRNDLQPYYYGQILKSDGSPYDITGATLLFTMRNKDGPLKITRQSVVITDAVLAQWEYRWKSGDLDTTGKYAVEVEVSPPSGGKFTAPVGEKAWVIVQADEDAT